MLDFQLEPIKTTSVGSENVGGTTSSDDRTDTLANTPVVPGSVVITHGTGGSAQTFTDQGDGTFSGTGLSSTTASTINYTTGAVSLALDAADTVQSVAAYEYFASTDVDARDIHDMGDTPVVLRLRNDDSENGLILQVSDNRETGWLTLYQREVPAWETPDLGRASVKFLRVYTNARGRIYGSALNLQ